MEQIQQLIAAGRTKDALILLVQINPDALLLQAQYNNGEKQFNLGLIDYGEWHRIQARVNFAALEMAKSKTGNYQPRPEIISSPIQTENMLVTFDRLFEDIRRDINGKNYVQSNVERYVAELNRICNTSGFTSILDPLKMAGWNRLLNVERAAALKVILDDLWSRKDKLRARIEKAVDVKNAETDFIEVLVAFFVEPNRARWEILHKLLSARFSDESLFSPEVLNAWKVWQTKLDGIESDLDWGLDFKGNQDERDLKAFLNKNLEIKNFNS